MSFRIPSIVCAALAATLGAAAPAALAAEEGLRVTRDPQTGQLRMPTARELKALERQESNASRLPRGLITGKVSPKPVHHANGMVSVELTQDQMMHSVVTRGADGKLHMHCVHDHAEAQDLGSGKRALAAKNSTEHADEK